MRRGIKRENNRSERGWCGQGENELPPGFGRGTERSFGKIEKNEHDRRGGNVSPRRRKKEIKYL
jgi:hypothetical protein